jgi:hypothetical protein
MTRTEIARFITVTLVGSAAVMAIVWVMAIVITSLACLTAQIVAMAVGAVIAAALTLVFAKVAARLI